MTIQEWKNDFKDFLKCLIMPRDDYNSIIYYIDDVPCDTANKWISVKDRLPNCNGIYLVWMPHYFGGEIGEPVVCYFDGKNTWHDSYGVDFGRILNPDDVTHWMPLPEKTKEVT